MTQVLISWQRRDQASKNCENHEHKNKKQWQKKSDSNKKVFQQKHCAHTELSWDKNSYDEENRLSNYSRIKNLCDQNSFHNNDQACDQECD